MVALVSPIVTGRRNVLTYGGAMLLAMVVMILTLDDGVIVRSEGALMTLAYVQFVYILYTSEGGEEVGEVVIEPDPEPARTIP